MNLRALAIAVALAALPRVSEACAVCFTGKDDAARAAFIGTTALLTLLPLLLLGAAFWWARRRFRELDREADGIREASQGS